MMVRARKTDTPPIPRTFEEIDLILRNPRSRVSVENIRRGIKMAIALPLLPQELFEAGRQTVRRWLLDNAQDELINSIERFCIYFQTQWGNQNVSVNGEEIRTNNAVESFHKCLKQVVENAQQNLALGGNVHLFLQRMSHAVDGIFNPPLAVDPLVVDQVLPAVAADGEQIAEEVHVDRSRS
ncbi:hypothetical protein FQR65_LT12549 [Abscondita terminalis]|nr:hypothetical protein FQR65_LT12549 [Abscondita terminalis]